MDKKILKLTIILITVIFVASYFVSESGYYEYTMQQRSIITNEKIKEFEEDVKNNANIDLKEYLKKEQVDYSNKFTNLVYNISDNSNKLAKKAIKYVFRKLGSLIED